MAASLSNLLLRVLAASAVSISFVAAQFNTSQFVAKISSTAAPPGYNVQGGTVFDNFVNALNDGQFFLLGTGSLVFEKPESEPLQYTFLDWCSDLTFSDSIMGYAARCVYTYAEAQANSVGEWTSTMGISAVFSEQLNAFEGQFHTNTDDWVYRYWDDGRKTMPFIAWEGHDEGDMAADATTASWSAFGEITWMTVEEVAQLLNTSTDEFTPDKFKQAYLDTWTKQHEKEAAEDNPNPEAEQEIIEEAKGETDSNSTGAGETTTPAEPGTGDGGTDASDPIDGSAGNGRKLTSVAARFVSAALRVFGI